MSKSHVYARGSVLAGLMVCVAACQAPTEQAVEAEAPAALEDPIQTVSGLVAGTDTAVEGVRAYKGLPFGAPPVGENRWRAPQPVEPWDGVRDASEYAAVCIQPGGSVFGGGRVNIAAMEGQPMGEDCLHLNVWTPAESASDQLPVMVYFYGGAFTEGGGSFFRMFIAPT